MDEILERILGIESEARAIVSEAQELATMLKEQAQVEAEQRIAHAREEAQQEVAAMREQSQQEVEEKRARILSEIEQPSPPVEEMDHFEEAVHTIVKVVSGRREGEA
jgi:vacuolar-type H+-ATPase subunit H